MYSQCPHCLTIYRLVVADLAGGRGQVACGSCDQVFDALATLSDELPAEPIERLDTPTTGGQPPVLKLAVLRPKSSQPSLFDAPARVPGNTFLRSPAVNALSPERRLGWWLGAAVLAILLLSQILYADRDRLLAIPTYRAWAESACRTLGCELPGSTQAIEGLALVSRDIRKHPTVDGALLISATLANRSDRSRPYPVLELRLSDLDERAIAMRRFQPYEYLSDSARIDRGMPGQTTLPVEFEVVDPGADAVAFEFRFLPAD
jgi:predicted Zn finger-like uncharacterized protein